jgi:AmmeMemoRadiSam system protein A
MSHVPPRVPTPDDGCRTLLAGRANDHARRAYRTNNVKFPAQPSFADGHVGRGRRYPTPDASLTGDRQSPRAAKQNRKRDGIGGRAAGGLGRWLRCGFPVLILAALTAGHVHAQAQAPADAAELTRLIDGFLAPEPGSRTAPRSRALLVPQVTDAGTGAVAGRAFAHLSTDIDRVVLIAPRAASTPPAAGAPPAAAGLALPAWESMRTALGEVNVDAEAVQACRSRVTLVPSAGDAAAERAMAAVLPFLQRRLPKVFRIVPLTADAAADPALLATLLKPLLCVERTAVVVLSVPPFGPADLDAVFAPAGGPPPAASRASPASLIALKSLAADLGWKATVSGHGQTSAGLACLSAILVDDPNRVDLLAQASKVAWDDPATLAAFQDAGRASGRTNFQGDRLSEPEQELLLGLARKTIYSKLKGSPLPAIPLYSDTLARPSGCFVTLNLDGKLRGCIGTILPKEPLATAVQHYALAAAFEDKRFRPVTLEELASIEIEVSAISVPAKAEYRDRQDLLDKLTPGVHGVLLTHVGGKRATFLPQVWGQFPDKATFLTALCRKGGIPPAAWEDPAQTTIELYESFDFKDKRK